MTAHSDPSSILVSCAATIAASGHAGQVREDGEPYILHPMRVALRLRTPVEQAVGLLHDVLEDSDIRGDILDHYLVTESRPDAYSQERVSWAEAGNIMRIVKILTRLPEEPYKQYIERIALHPVATEVKLADLEDNIDCTRIDDKATWEKARERTLTRYMPARARLLDARNAHRATSKDR